MYTFDGGISRGVCSSTVTASRPPLEGSKHSSQNRKACHAASHQARVNYHNDSKQHEKALEHEKDFI